MQEYVSSDSSVSSRDSSPVVYGTEPLRLWEQLSEHSKEAAGNVMEVSSSWHLEIYEQLEFLVSPILIPAKSLFQAEVGPLCHFLSRTDPFGSQ